MSLLDAKTLGFGSRRVSQEKSCFSKTQSVIHTSNCSIPVTAMASQNIQEAATIFKVPNPSCGVFGCADNKPFVDGRPLQIPHFIQTSKGVQHNLTTRVNNLDEACLASNAEQLLTCVFVLKMFVLLRSSSLGNWKRLVSVIKTWFFIFTSTLTNFATFSHCFVHQERWSSPTSPSKEASVQLFRGLRIDVRLMALERFTARALFRVSSVDCYSRLKQAHVSARHSCQVPAERAQTLRCFRSMLEVNVV